MTGVAPNAQNAPDAPNAQNAPSAKPKKRRVLRWVIGVLVALIAVLAGVIALFHDPILRALIKREATARGVDIAYESMDFGGGALDLKKVRLSLIGVRGLDADMEIARISLDGLFPVAVTRIQARSVNVRVSGSIADRVLEIGAWSKEHPEAYRIPVTATGIRVEWRETQGAAPWLLVSGGSLAPAAGSANAAGGVTFRAAEAQLGGVAFGPALAAWTADSSSVSLGFGKESPADAPIRVTIRSKPLPATVDIALSRVTMADLGSPMGIELPTEKATIEGTAKLVLGARALEEAVDGTVSMTLRGWVPPHPKELGGIVFGDRTTFTSAFRLSEDRARVTLTDSAVAAGAFKLKGTGQIDRKGDYALATMDMKGTIPCSDIARSAAGANFGDAVGAFVGDVARKVMEGSVAVSVHIDADTRALRSPRIKQDVGVGCGLRGLPSLLPMLPSPGDLPKLPDIPLPDFTR